MASLLARWTMARVPVAARQAVLQERAGQAPAEPKAAQAQVAIITNPKSLTFPVIVALVKIAWEGAMLLPVSWAGSVWVPFALCSILALAVACANLGEERPGFFGWLIGLAVAFVNGLVMFGAVMAVPSAKA